MYGPVVAGPDGALGEAGAVAAQPGRIFGVGAVAGLLGLMLAMIRSPACSPRRSAPSGRARRSERPTRRSGTPGRDLLGCRHRRRVKTWHWRHVNLWQCGRTGRTGCTGKITGSSGVFKSTECDPPRACTRDAAHSAGCGGHGIDGGWVFKGHVMCYAADGSAVPDPRREGKHRGDWSSACEGRTRITGAQVAGSAENQCLATEEPVDSEAACGTWTSCGAGRVPNSQATDCDPCPAGQVVDEDNRDDYVVSHCDPACRM